MQDPGQDFGKMALVAQLSRKRRNQEIAIQQPDGFGKILSREPNHPRAL